MSSLANDSTVINSVRVQTAGVSTPALVVDSAGANNNPLIDYTMLASVILPTRSKDFNDSASTPYKSVVIPANNQGIVVDVSDWCQLFISDANEVRQDSELVVVDMSSDAVIPENMDTIVGRTRGQWKRITSPIPKGKYRIMNQTGAPCSFTHLYAASVDDVAKRLAADKIVKEIVKSQLTGGLLTKANSIDNKVPVARVQTSTDSNITATINSVISTSISTGTIKAKIDAVVASNGTALSATDLNITRNAIYTSVLADPTMTTLIEGIKADVGSTSNDVTVTIEDVIKEKTDTLVETAVNAAIASGGTSTSSHPSTTGKVIKNGQAISTQGKTVIIPDLIVEFVNNFIASLIGESNIVRWEQLIVDNVQNEPASNMVYLTEQIILGITGYDYDSAVTLAQMVVAMHSQL